MRFLIDKFQSFLSRFTYRERFIFWGFLLFSSMPLPTYWILQTQNFFLNRLTLQIEGIYQYRVLRGVLDIVLKHQIMTNDPIIQEQWTKSDLSALNREFIRRLDRLEAVNLANSSEQGGEEDATKKSLYVHLKYIWEQIINSKNDVDFETNKLLHNQAIEEILSKLHQVTYSHELMLQKNVYLYELAEAVFFSLLQNRIFVLELLELLQTISSESASSEALLVNLSATLSNFQSYFAKTEKSLGNAYELLYQNSVKDPFSFDELNDQSENLHIVIYKFISLVNENIEVEKIKKENINLHSINVMAMNVLDALNKSSEQVNLTLEYLLKSNVTYYHWLRFLILFFLSIIIFVGVILLLFRAISGHILKLNDFLQKLLEGDFSMPLVLNPHDEVGEIAVGFKSMRSGIQDVVLQLEALSKRLAEFTRKITLTTEQQNQVESQQRSSLNYLGETIQRLAIKSREIANTMNVFTLNFQEKWLVDTSYEGLNQMQEKMDDLSNVSRNILDTLNKLHDSVASTRKLSIFMTKVSDHAQLLAFNVAIEAIQTSQPEWRTFRDLNIKIQRFAETTASSTAAIDMIINEMFLDVSLGKKTADKCLQEINIETKRLIVVSHQLSDIARQGKEQVKKFQTVNNRMLRQAAEAETMIEAITFLNSTADANAHLVGQLSQTIIDLDATAQEMRAVIHALFNPQSSGSNKV